jgi:hypothetical protein
MKQILPTSLATGLLIFIGTAMIIGTDWDILGWIFNAAAVGTWIWKILDFKKKKGRT